MILIFHSTEVDALEIDFSNGRVPRRAVIDFSIGQIRDGRPLGVTNPFRRRFSDGVLDSRGNIY